MLTANALSESRQQAMAAGADDFMSKPFQSDDLYALLARHLPITLIRAESDPATPPPLDTDSLARGLSALPAALRTRLEEAALSLDSRLISQVMEDIAASDLDRAQWVRQVERLCEHQQYSALWHILGMLEQDNQ